MSGMLDTLTALATEETVNDKLAKECEKCDRKLRENRFVSGEMTGNTVHVEQHCRIHGIISRRDE